jgi:hypothetical protein
MIVAVVVVLQRLFGLSDREAVEAFCFDARWKYACGGLDFDYLGLLTRCWSTCEPAWTPRARPGRLCCVDGGGRAA